MSKPYLKHTLKEGDHKVMRQGPPPHVGWWFTDLREAGKDRAYRAYSSGWRWWDGKIWSVPVTLSEALTEDTADKAERFASLSAVWPAHYIYWSYHWPEKARVGRINPETREVTGAGPDPYKE